MKIIRASEAVKSEQYVESCNQVSLKLKENNLEVLHYHLNQDAIGCFVPPRTPSGTDIYYVLSGVFKIKQGEEEENVLYQKDMLVLKQGSAMMTFLAVETTEILYLTSDAVYQYAEKTIPVANDLMDQINQFDGYTRSHCTRVEKYSMELARLMNYPPDKGREIMVAASMHDVGKIKVPKDILLKKGGLTSEEYQVVKGHSQYTEQILNPLVGEEIAYIAGCHHERYDGKGYPRGLKGEEIPLASRIMAVADAYDAMITQRGYNLVKSRTEAIVEIKKCSGSQFDPRCVDALYDYLIECCKKRGHLD